MSRIKSTKQFKSAVDTAFETMKTRDEAKACYDFQREEYRNAETELCEYAAGHAEVFEGREGASGWGSTDDVEYTVTSGRTVERADGGRLTDGDFLKAVHKTGKTGETSRTTFLCPPQDFVPLKTKRFRCVHRKR